MNFERALYWVESGAQPTETVHNILKSEGVYLMKHLRGGVKKGAFDEAAVQTKFDAWKESKEKNTALAADKMANDKKAELNAKLDAEKKVNEAIAKKIADKKATIAAAKAEEEAVVVAQAAAEATEATEAPAEAPAAE